MFLNIFIKLWNSMIASFKKWQVGFFLPWLFYFSIFENYLEDYLSGALGGLNKKTDLPAFRDDFINDTTYIDTSFIFFPLLTYPSLESRH